MTPEMENMPSAPSTADQDGLPKDWKSALACLLSSRLAIMQAESKQAAGTGVRKALLLVIAAFCALFTWILLLAGAVGAIASSTAWSWYYVAFAAAGIHVIIAIVCLLIVKVKGAPTFPVTRAEFEKDREWLNNLKNK